MRPAAENAKRVSSVPYDVVQEGEVRGFVDENPLSFLRITRAEILGEPQTDGLERAKNNLAEFIASGALNQDLEPACYVYRLTTDGHVQTGVVACCSIDEYENGLIKKHENTRPDKVADRTAHMLALRAQTGLIFLAYRGTNRIRHLMDEAIAGKSIYDFTCATGVRQTVWRLPNSDELVDAFGEVPALYIADGHHRAESAFQVRNELRDQNPQHSGDEDYNFVMAGMFPAEDLRILAYNRIVKGLGELSDDDILNGIQENFVLTETADCVPQTHGEICMYLSGKWYDLQHNVNYLREPDPIERLDVSILQDYVLRPVLGIDDARTDERIGFVGGIRGTDELERLVNDGEARIAFLLYPTTMDDLLAVSDTGEMMPPKSTWFEPKLKDGLFVHLI